MLAAQSPLHSPGSAMAPSGSLAGNAGLLLPAARPRPQPSAVWPRLGHGASQHLCTLREVSEGRNTLNYLKMCTDSFLLREMHSKTTARYRCSSVTKARRNSPGPACGGEQAPPQPCCAVIARWERGWKCGCTEGTASFAEEPHGGGSALQRGSTTETWACFHGTSEASRTHVQAL